MHSINTTVFFLVQRFTGVFPWLDAVFLFITNPLVFIVFGGICIWVTLIRPYRTKDPILRLRFLKEALLFVGVISLVFFVTSLIKAVVVFPRPYQYFGTIQTLLTYGSYDSFPSLHAAFSFAVATMVFFYKKRVGGLLIGIALLVAFSRVYVGVHFPIDVFVGALIGVSTPLSLRGLIKRYK